MHLLFFGRSKKLSYGVFACSKYGQIDLISYYATMLSETKLQMCHSLAFIEGLGAGVRRGVHIQGLAAGVRVDE